MFTPATPLHEALSEIDTTTLLSAILSDPTTGVAIARLNGELLFANDQSARIFVGDDAKAAKFIGHSLWEVFPQDWVRERIQIGTQILRTAQPAMIRTVWRGHQVLSWVYPLDDHDTSIEAARVLVISRHSTDRVVGTDDAKPRFQVFESKVISLGRLDVLSPRELEVLALVGQGLSIKEIADLLHRSEKTIQNHRDSIGAKLNLPNRVHVAEVARLAGLTAADAGKVRV